MRNPLALLAFCGLLVASPAPAASVVDLDARGALQRLSIEHPDQVDTVRRILRDASRLPSPEVEGALRTAYDATDVSLAALLLVSYPPKRRLAFRLGDVSYAATVTVSASPAVAVPAR